MNRLKTLSDILYEYSSYFEIYLALYHLCGAANEQELIALYNEALNIPYDKEQEKWRSRFVDLVLIRLLRLNTELARHHFLELETEMQYDIVYFFVLEWATMDIDSAIHFVERLSQDPQKRAARAIIDTQRMADESELILLGQRFDLEDYVSTIRDKRLFVEEAKEPERSWKKLVNNKELFTLDNFERIQNIVGAWVNKNGFKVLDEVVEVIENAELESRVLNSTLEDFTDNDPAAAFDWAVSQDSVLDHFNYNQYLNTVVRYWSQHDPEAALSKVSSMESRMSRLLLSTTVFRVFAGTDLQNLIQSIDQFPVDVRDNARVVVIEFLANNNEFEKALMMFSNVTDGSEKQRAAQAITLRWTKTDLKAALNWVLNDPATESESIREMLGGRMLEQLAHTEPEEAFELARSQPLILRSDLVGLEASIVSSIAERNIDIALRFLPNVREGKTKSKTYGEIGIVLTREGRIQEAVDLGNDLPKTDQDDYFFTVGMSIFDWKGTKSNVALFNILQLIPSDTARSSVAIHTIASQGTANSFSAEEIESLKGFLTEEDLKILKESEEKLESLPILLLKLKYGL
ncbi:MAG: hypothetical protein OXI36_09490 [Gammaproteobacteria bacterium]|nr:hypothetical protein [Gammaproteobacteria bacterium]